MARYFYLGRETHGRIVEESTWGTTPGSGQILMPFRALEINQEQDPLDPELNIGGYMKWRRFEKARPCNFRMETMLFRSTANMLMRLLLTRDAYNDLRPFTCDKLTPLRTERITGIKMASGELVLDRSAGTAIWTFEGEGKAFTDSDNDTVLPAFSTPAITDYADETPFCPKHVSIDLWDSTETEWETVTIRFNNTLEEGPPDENGQPAWIAGTVREISGTIKLRHKDDTYRDHQDAFNKGAIVITMTHPGGGSLDSLVLTLPQALIKTANPDPALPSVVRHDLEFDCEMSPTDGYDVAWSLT